MSGNSGAEGGFLLPQGFSRAFFRSFAENSFIIPRCINLEMTDATMKIPSVKIDSSHADNITALFGGIGFEFQGMQGDQLSEEEPEIGETTLTARDLTSLARISIPMLEDLKKEGESQLTELLGAAAAWYTEYYFIRGTGTGGQPLGIINSGGTLELKRSVPNSVQITDVARMCGGLTEGSWERAIWACSPTAYASLAQGNNVWANGIPESEIKDGYAGYLFGRPVYVTGKCPTVGKKGDVLLFDPEALAMGLRAEAEVTISRDAPQVFKKNQAYVRTIMRADAKPVISGIGRNPDNDDDVSPFVALEPSP